MFMFNSWKTHLSYKSLFNVSETDSDVEDVNSQKKNPDSLLNSYKILIETRKSHSILYGTLETHIFNTTVFGYTR